jgi:signal transduction histidine kinase
MLVGFTPRLTRTEVDAAGVLEEVFRIYDKEGLLVDLNLDKSIQSPCLFQADRRLLSVAMRGAVDALLPLARSDRTTTVAVRLAAHRSSRHVVLQVFQDGGGPPSSALNHWFDLGWRERPGGIACGLGLIAAKRVAELHGGRLMIEPGEASGCRLTMRLPIL